MNRCALRCSPATNKLFFSGETMKKLQKLLLAVVFTSVLKSTFKPT